MSWQIVRHAFVMVFGNLSNALRISLGPMLIGVGAAIVATLLFSALGGGMMAVGQTLTILVILPLLLFVFSWVAVAWHRFVLLEEYPGALPQISGRPIWPYVGKTLLLTMILIGIAIPLFFILALVFGVNPMEMAAGGGAGGGVLAEIAVELLVSYLAMRLSLVLPAVSVGQPMGFIESWRVTRPVSGAIVGVVLLLTGFNLIATLASAPLLGALPVIGALVFMATTWITMMVGVSILTTLYGYLVEGRDLT